jgi:hypothetical protein
MPTPDTYAMELKILDGLDAGSASPLDAKGLAFDREHLVLVLAGLEQFQAHFTDDERSRKDFIIAILGAAEKVAAATRADMETDETEFAALVKQLATSGAAPEKSGISREAELAHTLQFVERARERNAARHVDDAKDVPLMLLLADAARLEKKVAAEEVALLQAVQLIDCQPAITFEDKVVRAEAGVQLARLAIKPEGVAEALGRLADVLEMSEEIGHAEAALRAAKDAADPQAAEAAALEDLTEIRKMADARKPRAAAIRDDLKNGRVGLISPLCIYEHCAQAITRYAEVALVHAFTRGTLNIKMEAVEGLKAIKGKFTSLVLAHLGERCEKALEAHCGAYHSADGGLLRFIMKQRPAAAEAQVRALDAAQNACGLMLGASILLEHTKAHWGTSWTGPSLKSVRSMVKISKSHQQKLATV